MVVVLIVAGLYVLLRPVDPAKGPSNPPVATDAKAISEKPSTGVVATEAQAKADDPGPKRPAYAEPLPPPNPPSPQRQSPAAPPIPASKRPPVSNPEPSQTEVESLAFNIRQYQLRFGGNPVGTNAEIVRELTGGNEKGATYLPSDLKRLNDKGELVDRWGTAYFFHQEAADRMEVRSAGADRILWTSDDVVSN